MASTILKLYNIIYFIKCNNLIVQQAAVQAQQLAQSRAAQADSPLHIESDNSDDVSNNKRYDDIEDWEIPPKELILKINQQVNPGSTSISPHFNSTLNSRKVLMIVQSAVIRTSVVTKLM